MAGEKAIETACCAPQRDVIGRRGRETVVGVHDHSVEEVVGCDGCRLHLRRTTAERSARAAHNQDDSRKREKNAPGPRDADERAGAEARRCNERRSGLGGNSECKNAGGEHASDGVTAPHSARDGDAVIEYETEEEVIELIAELLEVGNVDGHENGRDRGERDGDTRAQLYRQSVNVPSRGHNRQNEGWRREQRCRSEIEPKAVQKHGDH